MEMILETETKHEIKDKACGRDEGRDEFNAYDGDLFEMNNVQELKIIFEVAMILEMEKILSTEMMYEMMIRQLKEMIWNRNHAGDWMTMRRK